MKRTCILLSVVLSVSSLSLAQTAKPAASQPSAEAQAAIKASNAMAFALYAELAKEMKAASEAKDAKESDGNLFYSPASIETCMAMVYAGARGQTEKDMAKALQLTM